MTVTEMITEKQLNALSKFAAGENMKDIFEEIKLDTLSKEQASELMDKCIARKQGNYTQNNEQQPNNNPATKCEPEVFDPANLVYFEYYKKPTKRGYEWDRMFLTKTEKGEIIKAHANQCDKVWKELKKQYPNDASAQVAIFERRIEHISTWMKHALKNKVRIVKGH